MSASIRLATSNDLRSVNEIYNESVLNSTASFDVVPRSFERAQVWFAEHDERYAVFVAMIDDEVEGWASISRWSERQAYEHTVESSVYIRARSQRQGLGRKLQETLIAHSQSVGIRTIIAQITSDNLISIRMHERFGFEMAGVLRSVGYKFDRWLDVCIMQLMLDVE